MKIDTLEDRQVKVNITLTSKLANITVLRQKLRPLKSFQLMKRGQLKPIGVSRNNLIYARFYATQMVRRFQKLSRGKMAQGMTPEEKQWFEEEYIRNQGMNPAQRFALLGLQIQRLNSKVDGKVDGLDHKFDGLDHKVDGLDRKFEGLDRKFDNIIALLQPK